MFFFQPADMVSQVLNLGLPARIDVQVQGRKLDDNYQIAQALATKIRQVPGAADVRVQQFLDYPGFMFSVDRNLATQVGVTERDVANQMNISLASSGQTAPDYWLDPSNGINYSVNVQTPQYDVSSMQDLINTPVPAAGQSEPELFGNWRRSSVTSPWASTTTTTFNLSSTCTRRTTSATWVVSPPPSTRS